MPTESRSLQVEIAVLGELVVKVDGAAQALPRSRKARALLAYLAITGREHRREHLSELFWDVADDRRAALRWSLSKLRKTLELATPSALVATRSHVQVRLGAEALDVNVLRKAARVGFENQPTAELEGLADLCRGELLEGLFLADFDAFEAWLEAERAEARSLHSKLRRVLVERLADEPERALVHARAWLARSGDQHAQRWTRKLAAALGREEALPPSSRAVPHIPAPTPRAPEPPVKPLVGRDREISRLCLIADEARLQRCVRVVLVIGEPGMGKTRLLQELLYRQAPAAPSVLEATFHEAECNRPLAPFLDASRAALAELGAPDDESTAPDREQLFERLARLIRRDAEQSGLGLLLLDDAHLCDVSSSELLHYVVRTAVRSPLMTIIACRPAEFEDNIELSRTLLALRRRQAVEEIYLQPLDASALQALVRSETPSASLTPLLEASAGNPLIVLELLRAKDASSQVPRTLADLVLARVASLPEPAASLVRWAAVLQRGPKSVLQAISARDVSDFVGSLETAIRYTLLRFEGASSDAPVTMAHALLHRIVYDAISPVRRAAMHCTVAEVLSRDFQDPKYSSLVVHHATLADRPDLAARALVQGALGSARVGAMREAAGLADHALMLVPHLEATAAAEVELEARLLLARIRRPAESAHFVARLTDLGLAAFEAGRPERARLAFHAAANVRWEAGAGHEGYGLARQAWQASHTGDASERVRTSSFMALCLALMESQLPSAQTIVHEAEALAHSVRGGTEPLELALARGMLHLHAGRLEDARRDVTDARTLARLAQNTILEAASLQIQVQLEYAADERLLLRDAGFALNDCASRMREGGETPMAQAALAFAGDDLQGARPALGEALSLLQGLDDKRRLAWVGNRWARWERERGHGANAHRLAELAFSAAQAVEGFSEAAIASCELMMAAQTMADDDAYAKAEQALAEREAAGTLSFEARTWIAQMANGAEELGLSPRTGA